MIWLLPHPLPPSPFSKLSLFQSCCLLPFELIDSRGGGRVGEEPIKGPRESLVLYKSFSTLWSWYLRGLEDGGVVTMCLLCGWGTSVRFSELRIQNDILLIRIRPKVETKSSKQKRLKSFKEFNVIRLLQAYNFYLKGVQCSCKCWTAMKN
jgi:hypothetical protein